MVEISYRDNLEVKDISGRTITEVRNLYRHGFSIVNRATAYLNGKAIMAEKEQDIILNDDDTLVFKLTKINELAYMISAA